MGRTQDDIYDELLVLRCQEGDGDAFAALFKRWQPRLGRLAWRMTADREATKDLVQDGWLAIVRTLRRLDDPARFRTWAYRIISNKCVDWTRKRVVRRQAERELRQTVVTDTDTRTSDTLDEDSKIGVALRNLPSEQRAMLSLHYLDGMRISEIATVFAIPVGTVKSRLSSARKSLKEAMERTES